MFLSFEDDLDSHLENTRSTCEDCSAYGANKTTKAKHQSLNISHGVCTCTMYVRRSATDRQFV